MTDRYVALSRGASNLSDTAKWLNVAGASVPAYGVVQFRTNFASGYNQASKPDGSSGLYYANGPVIITDGGHGESLIWNHSRLVLIEGSPIVGTVVGPVSDSWSMSESGTGFIVLHQPVDGVGAVVQVGGGGGDRHLHGIVVYSWGCGYYDVQLAEWAGVTPEPADSAPSASSGPDECNICDELIDGSGGACATDQTLPAYEEVEDGSTPHIVKRQVVGLVDEEDRPIIVLARHRASQFVPLQLWSDCMLTDLGDENETIGSVSGSGSATSEPVYQIVDGVPEHLIKYEYEEDCCNGVETIMRRRAIIFPGIQCPWEVCTPCEEA